MLLHPPAPALIHPLCHLSNHLSTYPSVVISVHPVSSSIHPFTESAINSPIALFANVHIHPIINPSILLSILSFSHPLIHLPSHPASKPFILLPILPMHPCILPPTQPSRTPTFDLAPCWATLGTRDKPDEDLALEKFPVSGNGH